MSELWSAQQREWLQAMGHTVLALAGTERAPEPTARPETPSNERRDVSDRAAPPRAGSDRAAPARNDAGGEHPLLRNLLRAARRASGDPAVLALFDAASLRGDAAAKRALWPRLRALRRGSARG